MFDLNSDDSGESEPDLEPLVVQPLLNPAAEDEAAAETTGAGGAAGAVVSAAPSNYTIGEVEHEQHHDAIVAAGELAANAEEDAAGISLIRSSKASSGFKGVHAKKGKFRAIFEQWSEKKRVSIVSLGYFPTARKAASAYALFANSQAVSALAPPAATLTAMATEAMDVEPNSGPGASSSAAHSEEVAVRRSSRKGKQPLDPAIGKRVWSWRQDLQRTMAGEIMDFHVWQDRVREHFVRYEDGVSQWRTEAEWWEDENGPTLPSPQ
jgi:hypothetical protein